MLPKQLNVAVERDRFSSVKKVLLISRNSSQPLRQLSVASHVHQLYVAMHPSPASLYGVLTAQKSLALHWSHDILEVT